MTSSPVFILSYFVDYTEFSAVSLVVLGHVLTGAHFTTKVMIRVINSFHMPAFFIISGLLTKENQLRGQSFWAFAKRRAIRLLVPYVVFELIGAVCQMILLQVSAINIFEVVHRIFTVRCYVGADWFLIALFFAEIILFWVVKIKDHKWYLLVLLTSFLLMLYLPDHIWFFANCRRIFAALSFIVLGICGRKVFVCESPKKFIVSVILLIGGASINSGTPSIGLRLFENPFLFVLCGLSGTYCVLFVANLIEKLPKMGHILQQCGMASLVIMGTHLNVIAIFNVAYGTWSTIETKIIILLAITVFEIPIIILFKRFLPSWVGMPSRDFARRNAKGSMSIVGVEPK